MRVCCKQIYYHLIVILILLSLHTEWKVLEQVCLAAIDLHDRDLVKDCLNKLQAQFPNSNRVRRLRSMGLLEGSGRFQEAMVEYSNLITQDESNSMLRKRKIAILIAVNKIPEAIQESCEYLKDFMNDVEAWIQLSNLYIIEQDYQKAAFCLEELILTSPQNHLYHEKYAEIQYTIKTPDSLELARAYYAQAVKLKANNLRALFGLILTCSALMCLPRISVQKKKECSLIVQWASKQVNNLYANAQVKKESQMDIIEDMLSSLTISN